MSQSYESYSVAAVVLLASVAFFMRRRRTANLIFTLPDEVIPQTDGAAFQKALDYSWAQQNCEIVPACIVRPRNPGQVSQVIAILAKEYQRRTQLGTLPLGFFAVRSGAANPGIGAAAVQDGVIIDLSLLCEVVPAADGSTVDIGTGAKWIDVNKALDKEGLIAVGGRNSPVGVAGLTLQGGISFYSPRFGFVCSNVVSYEIVLADGSIGTASATAYPDLWRVLKGGGNNFGIVTRFKLRSIPAAPLWSSQMIAPTAFQYGKAIDAYHKFLKQASSDEPGTFDENAAPPTLSFIYVQKLGLKLMSLDLNIFCETAAKLRRVKGLLFPFTFQSILPQWINKGFPNVLGLENCHEPLIIISCSVTWTKPKDDIFVRSIIRDLFKLVNEAAIAQKSDHAYRFMNYCMEWQQPYDGFSAETIKYMREASYIYDPNGLFQAACVGGFRLGIKT